MRNKKLISYLNLFKIKKVSWLSFQSMEEILVYLHNMIIVLLNFEGMIL